MVARRLVQCIVICCTLFTMGCQDNVEQVPEGYLFENTAFPSISKEIVPNLIIRNGYVSQKPDTVRIVNQNEETDGIVIMSEPIIVSQASDEQEWGYYQFPIIYRNANNQLVIQWQMKADSHAAYGEDSYGYMVSDDGGQKWGTPEHKMIMTERHRVALQNGEILSVYTPKIKEMAEYKFFPSPLDDIEGCKFFYHSDLPEDLKGVYFTQWSYNREVPDTIHAKLNDAGLLRYSVGTKIPIVWWGDIKEKQDGSLVAGVYPCYYLDNNKRVLRSTVSFYRSSNGGYLWERVGIVPHQKVAGANCLYDGNDGFTEPTFEILKDFSYICIMRTGNDTPLYKSVSKDDGKNWTEPIPITPNGVMPNLLLLDNNVLVLTSGRPGVQVRFCMEGDGLVWSEPINMLPFLDEKGHYDLWGATCGYTDIIEGGKNEFYLVYSDFKNLNENGDFRKAIVFRKIKVYKR